METKTEEVPEYINKDMTVGEVVEKYPQAAQVLTDYGLHCVGCQVATWETVEQGTLGHGMPKETMENMVRDANKFIHENQKVEKKEVKGTLEITSNAAKKLKELSEKEEKAGYGLRVRVVPGGCSGFQYEFNFEESPAEGDQVIEKDGLKVFIDEGSLGHIAGATVDFVDNLQETGFKIDNPNAQGGCGCGKSFN